MNPRSFTVASIFAAVLVLVALIVALVIQGIAWVADWLTPTLEAATIAVVVICLVVFAPMAAFEKTRGRAGIGFLLASYVFGFTLWMHGFLHTYLLWGVLGIVIGLLLLGVGVVPLGIIALAFNGDWTMAGELILGVILTFGSRAIALRVLATARREEAYRAAKIIDVEPTRPPN
jgi:hypothetical protein